MLAWLLAVFAWAQQGSRLSQNHITASHPDTVEFGEAVISPDGHRVAWTSGSDIFIKDLTEAASPPQRIAKGEDIAWSPDSQRLAFLSEPGHNGENQLYVKDTTEGVATRRLTNFQGALNTPQWSPDGKTLAFLVVENPPRWPGSWRPVPRPVGVVGEHIFEQRLALIDLASGQMRLVSPPDLYVWEYDWSPDSKRVVVNGCPGEGDNNWYFPQLDIINVASDTVKRLLKPNMQMKDPRWSPDGKRIAFIGGLMAGDLTGNSGDIYVIAAEGGPTRNITPRMKASAYRLMWLSQDRILFREFIGGDTGFAEINLDGRIKQLWRGVRASVRGDHIGDVPTARDGRTSAVVLTRVGHAAEVWAGDLGSWKQVTRPNHDDRVTCEKEESLHWQSDQWLIQGWLMYPRNYDPHRRYPMVVFVHGGPSGMVSGSCGSPFATGGYFVLYPNFRGSAGFGEAFTRADVKDLGYGDLRDILRGVNKAVATLPVDKKRIGITGHSYGGYMAMWAPTQTNVFHAAAASAGISDWLSSAGEADISNWVIPYFGTSIYDDPAIYAKSQPLNYIKNDKTPTLITVGADDGECPATQSLEFWNALKAMGVRTQLVIYPGQGHGMSLRDKRNSTARTIEWFNKYLK